MELDLKHSIVCNQKLDQSWARFHSPSRKWNKLRERYYLTLALIETAPVLDVGCGTGLLCVLAVKAGYYPVYGVDLSSTAITKARELLPDKLKSLISYHENWAEQLPFENEFFKTIVLTEVLEHVYDVRAAVTEADRVLRLGGRAIVSVPFRSGLSKFHLRTFHSEVELTKILPRNWKCSKIRKVGNMWFLCYCKKVAPCSL